MTTNNTAANVSLNGLTANELREAIAAKTVTVKAVIAYLEGKASLRAPSAKLLAELKGEAPAKVEPKAKVEAPAPATAKAEAILAITAKDFESLLSRIAALEAKVFAKAEPKATETPKPAKAKKAKAEAKAEAVEPVEPVAKPVSPKAVEPVAKAEPVEETDLIAYTDAKAALEGLSVKALRAHAKDLNIDATAKADIIEVMMAQALAEGEVFDDREGEIEVEAF